MKRIFFLILSLSVIFQTGIGQTTENAGSKILFRGLVIDASTLLPIANSQILINRSFTSVSDYDGTFAFYVNKKDTVIFKSLGYKPATMYVSDTLTAREFIAGIYMNSDTLALGEVVIIPKFANLRSEIMNARSKTSSVMENARYNVALSAYQGRNSQGSLGDPATNYDLIRQKQKVDAFERGGIPSSQMVSLSPLLLIPGAYLLIHGLPEKPPALKNKISDEDIDQIYNKYLQTLHQRK